MWVQKTDCVFIVYNITSKINPISKMSHTIAGLDNISRVDFIVICNLFAVKCSLKHNGGGGYDYYKKFGKKYRSSTKYNYQIYWVSCSRDYGHLSFHWTGLL